MEMMILSILGPQLHCEWELPGLEVALITSVSHSKSLAGHKRTISLNLNENVLLTLSGGFYWDGDQFTNMGQYS